MRDHTLQLADRAGQIFRIAISTVRPIGRVRDMLAGDLETIEASMTGIANGRTTAFLRQTPGYWRVLDHGFIRYDSGKVLALRNGSDATTTDKYLVNLDGTWGMQLWDYEDGLGVNGAGAGAVTQPWVLRFSPGKFSWALID